MTINDLAQELHDFQPLMSLEACRRAALEIMEDPCWGSMGR